MLRTVQATRYVTPLREGGSLPAVVEADDLGLYVVKFRGAGQGPLALVAELVAGEIGRALGLNVPELVFIEVDAGLGRNDPDYEIRHLLQSSVGLNLALDYLPGSTMFDPAARDKAPAELASMAVWFDAFVTNIDRTASNPNLLLWHKALYFIDHGAALYFHHNWQSLDQMTHSAFAAVKKHLLLRWASRIQEADAEAKLKLNEQVFVEILDQVPDAWLAANGHDGDAATRRAGYLRFLTGRLAASASFTEEALRARSELV